MAGDSNEVTWGVASGGTAATRVSFRGKQVPVSSYEQGLTRIGSGLEIERSQRNGLTYIKFNDYSAGLVSVAGIQPWTQYVNAYVMNQGIQTRIRGLAILPYALTAQTSLTGDISGSVAANRRAHAFNTSLGASGLRWGFALGPRIYLDTSTSNPALVELASTVFTDVCTAIEPNAVFNNTNYAAFAYNGATEDIRGFTTVASLAYNNGWTTLVALSANDYVNAMRYMPTLGPGIGVAVGTVATVNGVWYWTGTDAVPATLSKSPLAATANQLSTSTTTGSSVDLAVTGADNSGPPSGIMAVSGGAGAATPSAGGSSGSISFGNGNFTAFPKGRRVTGIQIVVAHEQASGTGDIHCGSCIVRAGGSSSISFADGQELGTSGTDTYGGSSVTGGLNITTDDLAELAVVLDYVKRSTGDGSAMAVSDVDVTITYANDGETIAFPNGGWQTSPSQAFPNRIAMVHPEAADKTAITVPRKLAFLDFEYDATTARPVFSISYPETNMAYIHAATPFQGGYAISGSDIYGPGKFIRHLGGDGVSRNLKMPPTNGSTEFRCNSLSARGQWLVADMIASDNTNAQTWLWNNGKWHPDTLMQSLGPAAIAAQSIPYAENALGLQQQQIYRIYPNSTSTAAIRQFLPDDLDADPRLVNTTQVKSMAFTSNSTEDTMLRLQQPEVDFGPEEALKTMLTADYQGRLVSASSTVTSRIDTGGDTSITAAEISKEFTTAFEHYDIPSAGVTFDTIIHDLGLKHTAGNAATPNGTGILYSSAQQWEELQSIFVEVDVASVRPNIFALQLEFVTLQNVKNVQPLKVGSKTFDAVYEGVFYTAKVPSRGQPISEEDLRMLDSKGIPQDTKVLVKFRQVRKTAA